MRERKQETGRQRKQTAAAHTLKIQKDKDKSTCRSNASRGFRFSGNAASNPSSMGKKASAIIPKGFATQTSLRAEGGAATEAEVRKGIMASRSGSGPVTSDALRESGMPPDIEAEEHDIDGLLAALLAYGRS